MKEQTRGLRKYDGLNGEEKKELALKRYYENPNLCINEKCNKVIEVGKHDRVGNIRLRKFCCKSCAAIYNNHKHPKRGNGKGQVCPQCGGKRCYGSNRCQKCKNENELKRVMASKISDYFYNGNARVKYVSIRKWAKKYLDRINRPKHCIVCHYSTEAVLEVAHIQEISSFPPSALMSEVNGADNLEYMCPTHHAEFDKGLLDIEEFRTKKTAVCA